MTSTTTITCDIHGWHPFRWCPTTTVLTRLRAHRAQQVRRYGSNSTTPDGTGPNVKWLAPVANYSATSVERLFRAEYDSHGVVAPSWMHLVREEVAEAFQEDDPAKLKEELLQVAALCVSWLEQLEERT